MTRPARPHPLRRRLVRVALGLVAVIVVVCVVGWIVLTSSPTPGALIIRSALNSQSAATKRAMAKHVNAYARSHVAVLSDLEYMHGRSNTTLDVYLPYDRITDWPRKTNGIDWTTRASNYAPVIVWIHGGGWLAGDKTDAAPYFKMLAAAGNPVVSVNYSLAPEHQYPGPVIEINRALGYLARHERELHLGGRTIVLAGDSAGAQLASQVAALMTNATYAKELGITPAISARDLVGTILYCGVYDAAPFKAGSKDAPKGPLGFAVATLMWAYAGTKDTSSPIFDQMSTIDHVTSAFPPTFISGGNADPLTAGQSKPFAAKLGRLGVPVSTLFFPADYVPKLEHEYQFDLDRSAATQAAGRVQLFLATV